MTDAYLKLITNTHIRTAIFEWLTRLIEAKKYEVNLNQAAYQALMILHTKGLIPTQPPANIRFDELYAHHISREIISLVTQVFWDLHLQGILSPSPSWVSSGSGTALITSYGIEVIYEKSRRIQTHDPEGYLSNFVNQNPPADSEMLLYVQESVSVFQHGHLFACVILLGVASERLLTALATSLRDALGHPHGTEWFQKKFRGDASEKFKATMNQLLAEYGPELEREKLKEALQGCVKPTFEIIRHARNDIVHPKGRELTWNEVSGFLHNFVQYFKYTNQVIALLHNNPRNPATK